ncbi:amidohydrolase [Arthrobacter roseus]|uniref:amidohydrolase n=1 Tax=Arthrobacter roseus TaxID=136274 RepID=UPI0030840C83|nr:putative amidohydrolase YtcJ [Arthrobacter roseus]
MPVLPSGTSTSRPILYRNGSVYSAADPFATAMLVDGDTVAWVGSEYAATSIADHSMDVVDLDGALITPGFVDSHVHLTETGIALASVDLSGIGSLAELLSVVERAADRSTGMIVGFGWDESFWPERRWPSAAELDAASGHRAVYLVRADIHSAVVSGTFAASLRLQDENGWDNGFVVREAHEVARSASRQLTLEQRHHFQTAAFSHAASRGIVAVAEMAAPHISPVEDLRLSLGLDGAEDHHPRPEVLPYWGQVVSSADHAREVADQFEGRLLGLAGDLNIDGSIGSYTAALREGYSNAGDSTGTLFLGPAEVAAHLCAATEVGLQAGFHVIGDRALDTVIEGLRLAERRVGLDRLLAAGHRLEHVEMTDDDAVASLLRFGVTCSMQPGFDSTWGRPQGMYSQRLGERSKLMNRVGTLISAGVPVSLGSDSPVVPMDPWSAIRGCMQLGNERERISARAAFIAHTRAGWRAARNSNPMLGQLAPGTPASYAVWQVEELMVQTPDNRVQSWSTDPRAGTPLLPALDSEKPPLCLRTVHRGNELHNDPAFG